MSGMRLRQLFLAARAVDPEQRQDLLLAACPEDAAMRAEVLALLAAAPLPDRDVIEKLAGEVADTFEPGARFGRFTLLEPLGAGGMGRVDLAFDPRSGRQVAIKRLRSEWLRSADAIARFEREILATSRLEARGLCPVYEVGNVEGTRYYVMPVVRGETLEARLSRTSGPVDAAAVRGYVALFEKLARSLHCAHTAGLVHRDVKPGNIMVEADGEPMLLDFGLVQDQRSADLRLTRTGQLAGTPSYMAPEQLTGGVADCRTDVHALGVVLFECVCGGPPFGGDSSLELFAQIQQLPLPSPRRRNRAVSADLAVVLAVATEKNPERRYRSAAHMADDLARVLARQPVHARRQAVWIRLGAWVRRNPSASAIICALAAGLVVTLLLQFERGSINAALRRSIDSEQHLQRVAGRLRAAAQDRLDDFEGLAVLSRTARAIAAERQLHPAWPEHIGGLRSWLDDQGKTMTEDLRRITATTERLCAQAAPDAEELARRIGDLDRRIAALRSAIELRHHRGPLPGTDLPADAPQAAAALLAVAWPWVDPERPDSQCGQERLAFAYLLHALERAGAAPIRFECARSLLFAFVATGADMGGSFPAEIVAVLAAAPSPAAAPDRFRSAVMQADAVRRQAGVDLARSEAERAQLIARRQDPWRGRAADAAVQVLATKLREGRAMLERQLGPAGVRQRVQWNLEWAERIERLTTAHPRARVSWAEAAAAIATADGVTASTAYAGAGIELEPVMGLVPIGKNPVTGLWEFYHLRSAFDPRQGGDPADLAIPEHRPDGSIELHEGDGMVFVLLPGGQVGLGAQTSDPTAPGYYAGARGNEARRQVEIAPFFLARHELTQAQWMRLALTDNPSEYAAGNQAGECRVTGLHPVERVSPHQSSDLLRDFGLRLPGEWEWEYACRAGTDTAWSSGPQPADLEGHANLADLAHARVAVGSHVAFDDGHAVHAPVGTFAANAFGFHDMHGNVAEPCREPTDGLPFARQLRGGNWARDHDAARSSYRASVGWNEGNSCVGVRAARSLPRRH